MIEVKSHAGACLMGLQSADLNYEAIDIVQQIVIVQFLLVFLVYNFYMSRILL